MMYNDEIFIAIMGIVSPVIIAAATTIITIQIKLASERRKASEDWRSYILEKHYYKFEDFQKLAQQFAIAIIFYEDPSREGHHQKIFIPKNFNLTIGRGNFNDNPLSQLR